MNSNRTKAEQDWQDELREMGCLFNGSPAEIDHIFGAKTKANKLKIGEWAVIPLSANLHRNDQVNRSSNETEFNLKYTDPILWNLPFGSEKSMFLATCCRYMAYYQKDLPFSNEILIEIMRYRR